MLDCARHMGSLGLLSDEELEVYTQTFAKSGFRGGISWYRNFDRNWELHPEIGSEPERIGLSTHPSG